MRRLASIAASAAVMIGVTHLWPIHAQTYGPQTPRDITKLAGTNGSAFSLAPPASKLNLCNIHFHAGAEHRGPGYLHPVVKGGGDHGHGGDHGGAAGFQCNDTTKLTPAQLSAPPGGACKGLKPGDTIEVHWVHTSCATAPGPTLGACAPDYCKNPTLRVEAQVFLVVNDRAALDFARFDYAGPPTKGVHRARALPAGNPVVFRGSTTGPAYDDKKGSPYEATWSVRPACARIDINSLHRWCANNVFKEDHGHGVRKLVTDVAQLDAIGRQGGVVAPGPAREARVRVRTYCGGTGRYRNAETGACEYK